MTCHTAPWLAQPDAQLETAVLGMQKLQYGDSIVLQLVLPDSFDPELAKAGGAAARQHAQESYAESQLHIHMYRARLHDPDLGEPY